MIERDPFEALLTAQDPQMLRTIERARRVADVDVALLIQGEPGTGKLILARTIHEASKRRDGPFLTLDLATIAPGQVVEALYGTEDGQNQGPGLLAKAADGTLVLDSIGELPADAQRALLGELGADEHCDARIMVLTHHNLVDDVRAGRFDLDLYYALAVGVLRIPALRDRPDDILLMTDHFFKQRGDATGSAPQLTEAARQAMRRQPWFGNVREVANVVQRLLLWSEGDSIGVDELLEVLDDARGPHASEILERPLGEAFRIEEVLGEVESHYIQRALSRTGGNKARAATLLGMNNSTTLSNRMKRYGLS